MKIKPFLKPARQTSQLLCLAVFLFLFRQTDYSGAETLPWAVNIIFRMDPLVLACLSLAGKAVYTLLWPALVIIIMTFFLGRFFCGWICPMGTLIDIVTRAMPKTGKPIVLRHIKYLLLIIVLGSSLFGFQLMGFVDPFSILIRSLALAIDPAVNFLICGFFDTIYLHLPETVSRFTEPIYSILKTYGLPFRQSVYLLGGFSFLCLALIFVLERWGKRFWCRNLCPLGGLFAVISCVGILKRFPHKTCRHCEKCSSQCHMEVVDSHQKRRHEECTMCMDCIEFCPEKITTFKPGFLKTSFQIDVSKRALIGAGMTGVAFAAISRTSAIAQDPEAIVIRPPGAQAEQDFLASCVRCGECMKVCITNGLQPLLLEKGIEGIFTPVLKPRLGYCEYNCTLCSQVCPTSALHRLTQKEKHRFVIGQAFFDINRCLVYTQKKMCIVCEEHCPVSPKAIRLTAVDTMDLQGSPIRIKQPWVDPDTCIGCGICENVCPVSGKSAILVQGVALTGISSAFGSSESSP